MDDKDERRAAGLSCGLGGGRRSALGGARFALGAAIAGLLLASAARAELPLQPARVLTLNPARTTWTSVSVSPDGRLLAFDVLGDLYTMPAGGGAAVQVSKGLAFDSQPVFSPDGRRIAFTSDRGGSENVWIAGTDGSAARAISGFDDDTVLVSPAWSADGKALFASRFRPDLNNYELWRFAVDGGAQLVVPIKSDAGSPRDTWRSSLDVSPSPDGRWLYFARRIGGPDFDAPVRWTIVRRDLATGAESDVIAGSGGRGTQEETFFAPHISPDGRHLVYGTRRDGRSQLRVRDLATGADTALGETEPDALQASSWQGMLPGMAFTPDSDAVILSHDGRFERRPLDGGKVQVIARTIEAQVAVGPMTRVALKEETGPVTAKLAMAPATSPGGTRIAFAALGGIWVQDVGAGKARRLPFDLDMPAQPSWSADGRRLAFVTWSESDGGAVWTVPAQGNGKPRKLTALPAYYRNPVFTPDRSGLLVLRSAMEERRQTNFEYGPLRKSELVRIDLASGNVRVIAQGQLGGRPHFAADAALAYLLTDSGLESVDLKTGARAVVAKVTGPGWYFAEGNADADDMRISPDGKLVAASIADRLYVLPRPADPAKEVDLSARDSPARVLPGIGADWFEWSGAARIDMTCGTLFSRRDALSGAETAAMRLIATAPRSVPEGSLLLHGARVLTMAEGDRVIENADVLVTRDRIAAVGPAGSLAVPAGAAVRDVSGKTILPGFIDVHDHIAAIRRGNLSSELWDLRTRLAYGVTTSFDPSTLSVDHLAYQGLVDAGLVLGPRLRSTGPAIFSKTRIASLEDARRVVSRYSQGLGLSNLKEYRTGSRKVRQWLIIAAREQGMNATTEGALALKLDLSQILDGYPGNEHALPAVLGDDVIGLLTAMRTSYDTTLSTTNGGAPATDWFAAHDDPVVDAKLKRFWSPSAIRQKLVQGRRWHPLETQRFPAIAADLAGVAQAGGLVGMGAHGEVAGIGYHWELEAHALGGMAPMAVLHAATAGGAETIGRLADLGTVEVGKLADLVVLDEDPRQDVRKAREINAVMRGGFLYEGETLRPLWPQEGPATPAWFEKNPPEQWLPITDPPSPEAHH